MKYLAVLIIALFMFACAHFVAQAQMPNGHPWRGHAMVCVAAAGQPAQCQELTSNDSFDSKQECEATMESRLHDLADYVHHQDPRIDFLARYVCTPDENEYSG